MKLLLYIGVASGIVLGTLAGIAVYIYGTVSAEIALATRDHYIRAILANDAEWHSQESHRPANLQARLEKSVLTLQAATSAQLNFALMGCGMFFFGMAFAFYYSWKLTLVFLVAIPLEMVGCVYRVPLAAAVALAGALAVAVCKNSARRSCPTLQYTMSLQYLCHY
jgi:ABC-type bacteriocin/lantibiotic exporter with double-glycine peptidase domain